MAHRVIAMKAVPIIAGGFVVCLVLFPLITVWMWAETGASLGAADWSAIRFTIWQAFLSALLSCVAAIRLRGLWRGKGLLGALQSSCC